MVDRVKELSGRNMDIDLASKDIAWKQIQCPWNVDDNTNKHKCEAKGTSTVIFESGLGVYIDEVLKDADEKTSMKNSNLNLVLLTVSIVLIKLLIFLNYVLCVRRNLEV